ncbi:MAG TPA: hypothetical protein VGP43_11735 [Chitinophagaceae bacterium]|nr:hypothetical protein [Chitinophagaceae bacterium]
MRKFISLLFGLFLITAIQPNVTFSSSIKKPVNSSEMMSYVKGREFVKLSFKEFVTLTGQKASLWNKVSFNILKNKIKHDLINNPNLAITQYYSRGVRTAGKVVYILILLLIIVIAIALKK